MLTEFAAYRTDRYPNPQLIVVDIQPSYRIHLNIEMEDFVDWLQHHQTWDVLYLYNGPEMGLEDETEIRAWLRDYGLTKFDNITFFEKGYGFFRDLMDSGVNDEQMITLGKYMIDHDLEDLGDIKSPLDGVDPRWLEPVDAYLFKIPALKDELVKFLKPGAKPLVIGGGKEECFKEVLLLLAMLDYEWDEESQFIY